MNMPSDCHLQKNDNRMTPPFGSHLEKNVNRMSMSSGCHFVLQMTTG